MGDSHERSIDNLDRLPLPHERGDPVADPGHRVLFLELDEQQALELFPPEQSTMFEFVPAAPPKDEPQPAPALRPRAALRKTTTLRRFLRRTGGVSQACAVTLADQVELLWSRRPRVPISAMRDRAVATARQILAARRSPLRPHVPLVRRDVGRPRFRWQFPVVSRAAAVVVAALAFTGVAGMRVCRRLWSRRPRVRISAVRGVRAVATARQIPAARLSHLLPAARLSHLRQQVPLVTRRIGRLRPRWQSPLVSRAPAIVVAVLAFTSLAGMRVCQLATGSPAATTAQDVTAPAPVILLAATSFETAHQPHRQPIPDNKPTPVRTQAAAANPSAPELRRERQAIQSVLNRYRDAFSILDVRGVQAVWPAADVDSIRKQFAAVDDQVLEFEACRVAVATGDSRATATCTGVVEFGFNAGQRRLHSEARQWQFTLQKVASRWTITQVATTRRGTVATMTSRLPMSDAVSTRYRGR